MGISLGQGQQSVRVMAWSSRFSGVLHIPGHVLAAGLCPLLSQPLKQAADHRPESGALAKSVCLEGVAVKPIALNLLSVHSLQPALH